MPFRKTGGTYLLADLPVTGTSSFLQYKPPTPRTLKPSVNSRADPWTGLNTSALLYASRQNLFNTMTHFDATPYPKTAILGIAVIL